MTTIHFRHARLVFALTLALGAALAFACAPAFARRVQTARAEAVRTRCVAALGAHRSWRADVVQTENGTDGSRAVMRQKLLVRGSGESRTTITETDTKGRRVVSTTVRSAGRMVTRRVNADGSTVLHVFNGVRPTLGLELDNILGETVRAVADAKPLKVVGRDMRGGDDREKLQIGAGHFVWIDRASGLPVEEQVVSDGKVAHDLTFSNIAADVPAPDSEFDAGSLGPADETVVEDLGFREVDSTEAAAVKIGFVPLGVPTPQGYSMVTQGYVDPSVPAGDAPSEAAFVTSFANGVNGVIVTQTLRPGIGDSLPDSAHEGPDAARAITVAGHPGVIYDDGQHLQLTFARRDVLVTIEGALSESSMMAFAEAIR